jgi:hypothetical protein
MKKTLTISCLFSVMSLFAQTMSDYSGNQPLIGGYQFMYDNSSQTVSSTVANCMNGSSSGLLLNFGEGGNIHNSLAHSGMRMNYDNNEGVAKLEFDGTQTLVSPFTVRLTEGNCLNMDNSGVDLSNNGQTYIKARIKPSIDMKFGFEIGLNIGGNYQTPVKTSPTDWAVATVNVTGNVWQEVEIPVHSHLLDGSVADLSKAIGVSFIVNDEQKQGAGSILIDWVKIGDGVLLDVADSKVSKESIEIYPNPVSNGIVNFSKELTNVSAINAFGEVVFSSSLAKELNVVNFSKGIYILKSDEGTTKFIVE